MRNAERVTFGGSGLNRASELRGSAKASPREGDLFIIHWRGKFAIDLKNACELALIKYPNKIISNKQIIFLEEIKTFRILLLIFRNGSLLTKMK